ncbi:hypothetical protein HJA95_07600 [Rhizobium binae]|uniref:hypothetical protein n=1 Tax=Rhizobium binae TaxID=1138190 RepID=UPI001C82CF81|nr:hypothetical protein [Rhizobium binae]MBX4949454.1 hypothetical protein [Rhizobium binae]
MNDLDNIRDGTPKREAWGYAYSASSQLDALVSQSLYKDSLVACRFAADKLKQELGALIAPPFEGTVDPFGAWNLAEASKEFKTIFLAELATLPAFFVTSKRPLEREALLQAGETLMPEDLITKVPEAIHDAREAAICLAFDRCTASAFHLFRALEAVVRAYHRTVGLGAAPPKQRNLGVYIRALRNCGANPKAIAALEQLKDLHRNPIAHPEALITLEEALGIYGVVRSAVAAMLADIPGLPQNTRILPISAHETTLDAI